MTESSWDAYWKEESNRAYWLEPDEAVVRLRDGLDRNRVKTVLDLGCGIGRHAVLFAEAGFQVTAVDSSEKALGLLRGRAGEKGLSIEIIRGDFSQDLFRGGSFDFILACNVLYHGLRDDFKQAVLRVHRWLRPGGLFFFTCPSRRDAKYGSGGEVAEHAYRSLNSAHPGDIHYFADESDFADFLSGFSSCSSSTFEHYWVNRGVRQFASNWQILAIK